MSVAGMPGPICDYVFLRRSEWEQCRDTADRMISAVRKLPTPSVFPPINLSSRGNGQLGAVHVGVSGMNVSSPDKITAASSSIGGITVTGLMAKEPWPFTTALAVKDAHVAARLRLTLIGAITHELTHCLAARSGCFDQSIWDEAVKLSAAYAATRDAHTYRAYVLHPYERHAHTTQIISAAALLAGGPNGLRTLRSSDFRTAFYTAFPAARIADGDQGRKSSETPLLDELWRDAQPILDRMA